MNGGPTTDDPAGVPVSKAASAHRAPDAYREDDHATWLAPLRSTGSEHDHVVRELHQLLLRGAHFEVRRRTRAMDYVGDRSELDDLALQAADDAFVTILGKLDTFEGRSRFTTWAYKFAVHIAGVAVRQHVARLWMSQPSNMENAVPGTVVRQVFLGASRDYLVELPDGTQLRVVASASENIPQGSSVWLYLPPDRCRVLSG